MKSEKSDKILVHIDRFVAHLDSVYPSHVIIWEYWNHQKYDNLIERFCDYTGHKSIIDFLTDCGFVVKFSSRKPQKRGKSHTVLIICIAAILFVVAIGVAVNKYLEVKNENALKAIEQQKNESYIAAIETLNEGNYDLAISAFTSLSGYQFADAYLAESKYKAGLACMESENWDKALSYFEDINYENSNDLRDKCEYEIEIRKHDDYSFLKDLEAGLNYRKEQANNEDSHREIIDAEMSRLSKYVNSSNFYDIDLKEYADEYIAALRQQQSSLQLDYVEEAIEWRTGFIRRAECITNIHNSYPQYFNPNDLDATYTSQITTSRNELNAIKAARDDLSEQLFQDEYFTITGDSMVATYTNNTYYTFSFVIYIEYFNENGDVKEILGSSAAAFENVDPRDQVKIEVSAPIDEYRNREIYYWTFEINFDIVPEI